MQLNKLRRLGIRGDTIVEVLIVLIVLTSVLTVAYTVATRSQRTSRQTEEHTQALKMAESQLENIRAYSSTITDAKFCFDSSGQLVTLPSGVQAASAANENFALYPDSCKRGPDGNACTASTYCYYISVNRDNNNLYTVAVRWDGVRGQRDQVTLQYRMPPS